MNSAVFLGFPCTSLASLYLFNHIIKCEGTTVTHPHECESSFSILCGIKFVVVVVETLPQSSNLHQINIKVGAA